jgi:hypothetical protein
MVMGWLDAIVWGVEGPANGTIPDLRRTRGQNIPNA